MNSLDKKILREELRSAGAEPAELKNLLAVAGRLATLGRAVRPARWLGWLRVAPLAAAVVFAVVTVVVAQASLPGEPLYGVKRASENAAVLVAPSYRASLMMRRADEVRDLVAAGAGSRQVAATLAAYQVQAAAYTGDNYPAFRHCKASLLAAEVGASAGEKAQIARVLEGLGDVQ